MNITCFNDFYLVGAKYYQLPWVLNYLKVGDEMALIPEPENHYDENAVAIHFQDHKLGFVPRTSNSNLQQLHY